MTPRIVAASFVQDYVVRLRFADGAEGDIDLTGELDGEMFLPLRDPDFFRQFRLVPELHTLVWPNGADFAPEFLYQQVKVAV
jgi:hypothetical protein